MLPDLARTLLRLVAIWFVVSSVALGQQPNFIIILCDNLGYGDIEPFGSKVHRTPQLDRMAREGRKFTHFCVTAGVCTPSRASLLTGSYAQRLGMHRTPRGEGVLFPISPYGLHPDEVTIAEILKEQGYATTIIGKWHLGDQPAFLPLRVRAGEARVGRRQGAALDGLFEHRAHDEARRWLVAALVAYSDAERMTHEGGAAITSGLSPILRIGFWIGFRVGRPVRPARNGLPGTACPEPANQYPWRGLARSTAELIGRSRPLLRWTARRDEAFGTESPLRQMILREG